MPKNFNDEFKDSIMQQFTEFGRVKIDGALTYMAAVSGNKQSYNFNPTIVIAKEFPRYLEALATIDTGTETRERFVMAPSPGYVDHWIAGEIFINKDGTKSMLIMDSLGPSGFYSGCDEFFKKFPLGNIYYAAYLRQNSPSGCSIFSLDDVRHLFTIDNYLPRNDVTSINLWKYLQQHIDNHINWDSDKKVNFVKLPLPFLRTTQTSNLFAQKADQKPIIDSYDSKEKEVPLGKKKSTMKNLSEQFKKNNNQFMAKNGGVTKQNGRLQEQLIKMQTVVEKYLNDNTEESIKHNRQKFTLEAFEKKVLAPPAKRSLILSQSAIDDSKDRDNVNIPAKKRKTK
jgi:hypothetical protein